jgi:hypothetical protein
MFSWVGLGLLGFLEMYFSLIDQVLHFSADYYLDWF